MISAVVVATARLYIKNFTYPRQIFIKNSSKITQF